MRWPCSSGLRQNAGKSPENGQRWRVGINPRPEPQRLTVWPCYCAGLTPSGGGGGQNHAAELLARPHPRYFVRAVKIAGTGTICRPEVFPRRGACRFALGAGTCARVCERVPVRTGTTAPRKTGPKPQKIPPKRDVFAPPVISR